MRKNGLVHKRVWQQLRERQPRDSDCALVAFLIQVAAGRSYQLMPSNRAERVYWVENRPGQSMCVLLSLQMHKVSHGMIMEHLVHE